MLILPLVMRAVKVILTVRVILTAQVALTQILSVKKRKKHVGDPDYRRFDTGAQARTNFEVTNDLPKYVNEKFTISVKDKAIQESVLDSNPIPDAESLKIPKVDGYLNEIFDTLGKSYGRESDGTLSKTQARINNVMGPLGKLWLNLQNIRTDDSTEELDLFDCLKLVEQSVTLLGQANMSFTYARRLSILGRLPVT